MRTAIPALPVMEYATTSGATLDPRAKAVAAPLMLAAVGSGLCVGVCFLAFAEDVRAFWVVAHPLIFLITLGAGVIAGMRMRDGYGTRMVCDCVAGAGIVGLAIMPLGWLFVDQQVFDSEAGLMLLGICYLLMTATTVRHLLMYRLLATWARQANWRGLARSLIGLGWTKAIYEGVWLGCCAAALLLIGLRSNGSEELGILFAFGAFFGCFGYAGIWVWMMITHAMLMQRVKA